jgi:hypothetical protein
MEGGKIIKKKKLKNKKKKKERRRRKRNTHLLRTGQPKLEDGESSNKSKQIMVSGATPRN